MNNMMIDLETLSLRKDCVITQIGMVEFSENGSWSKEYDVKLAINKQKDRTIDHDTLQWWMEQEPEARDSALGGKMCLDEALRHMHHLIKGHKVWGNGASFDIAILEHAFQTRGIDIPWSHRDVRDTRTLWALHGRDEVEFVGTAHDAVADCIQQIKQVAAALQRANPEF